MQRRFLQALIHHTDHLYLVSSRTSQFHQGWCLKRFPDTPIIGHQMTIVLGSQKMWLHASAPHRDTSVKKPLDVPPVQPRVPLQNEPEKPSAVAGTYVTEEPVSGSTVNAGVKPNTGETDPLQDRSLTLFQRFKRTFKQYGKVLIPVHLVTSTIWFGSFYYAAMKGVNVVPFLEFIGLPESIVGILKKSQGGNALTAYALYKISTPARYTVTLGGTSISVKYLRKYGYMSTPPPVKEYIQDKMEETKGLFTEKIEETRDMISGKMEETKDRITEKIQETKDSFMKKKE